MRGTSVVLTSRWTPTWDSQCQRHDCKKSSSRGESLHFAKDYSSPRGIGRECRLGLTLLLDRQDCSAGCRLGAPSRRRSIHFRRARTHEAIFTDFLVDRVHGVRYHEVMLPRRSFRVLGAHVGLRKQRPFLKGR